MGLFPVATYHACRMAGNRYLFLRLSALGDILFALEALAALKQAEPEARVDWLVEDRGEALLRDHPLLDQVLVYPRRLLAHQARRPWLWPALALSLFRHLRALRARDYDAALDLHGNLKSGLHLFFCRARRKLGYAAPRAKEGSQRAARERVHLPDEGEGRPRLHRAEEGLLMIQELLGGDVPRPAGPYLEVGGAARRAAEACLSRHPRPQGPWICLIPGTSEFAAFKRWPPQAFARLATLLSEAGCRVLVGSGPGEEALAKTILEGAPEADCLHVSGAELGLDAYLAVLAQADAVVAADSGPLHMAQALGTPVVGLFGPKDPAVYGPRLAGSRVLRYPVPCAPCGRRSCDAPLCVQAIPPEAILECVTEMLNSNGDRRVS